MKFGKCFTLLLLLGILAGCAQILPEQTPGVTNTIETSETVDISQPDQPLPITSQSTDVVISTPQPDPTILPTSFYQIDPQFNLLPAGFYLTFYDLETETLEAFSFQLTQKTLVKSDTFSKYSNNTRFALHNQTLFNLQSRSSLDIPDVGTPNCDITSISITGAILVTNCEENGIGLYRRGSEWVSVFEEEFSVENPILSPDDQQILFCMPESNEDYSSGIYRFSIDECLQDDGCRLSLISTTCDKALFAWSPDAKIIAVAKQEQGIYLIDLATGSKIELLAPEQVQPIEHMVWSPDGRWIAYSVLQENEGIISSAIYLIHLQATEPRLFYESDHQIHFVGWLNNISPFKPGKHYIVLPSENQFWLKDIPDDAAFNKKLLITGEKIRVLENSELVDGEPWWQVRVGDYTGWVKESSLHFQDDWMYGLTSPVFEPGRRLIVKQSGNELRLRAMPSLNGAVKRYLLPGTRLRIVDGPAVVNYYRWWLVEIEDSKIYGWVVEEALWYASD